MFPTKKRIREGVCLTDEYEHVGGMTLRDYFAAKAMQGLQANPADEVMNMGFDAIAKYAYEQADAMLEARKA